jgi:molybdopterin-containing oxidoreductase family iron-sulfur binding subunit
MNFKNKYSGKTMKDVLMDDAKNIMNLNRGSIRANDLKTFWNGLLSRGGWWDVKSRVSKLEKTKLKQWPKINNPEFSSSKSSYHLIPFKTTVSDGSLANLPWLQGLTDPMTTIAWETWVEINEQEADKLKIKEGDVLEIDNGNGRKIKAVAYPTPATPPNVLSVPVGGGQKTGRYTSGFGTNIYSIMNTSYDSNTGAHAWASNKVNIKKTKSNIRIPKFEGRFEETKRDPHNHIIKIKSSDSDH